ncbi:hypothetical protein [Chroococcus sp. FPU101]|uniref:hypothetical protein n=1 Tax=Chroococcus sp. FPU101 TaxID=1974212 RepID=UPI001A8F86BB|nr:hypothetical protein [Chroococcus sp. FPU101]GFE69830.1 hypothetical protein CFPU101_24400 [Chroococcus sp. FPU101]
MLLSHFSNNAKLLGITATLTNALFLVSNFRKRIAFIVTRLDTADIADETIQEAGEDLSEFLGRILESKISVDQAVGILEDLV